MLLDVPETKLSSGQTPHVLMGYSYGQHFSNAIEFSIEGYAADQNKLDLH